MMVFNCLRLSLTSLLHLLDWYSLRANTFNRYPVNGNLIGENRRHRCQKAPISLAVIRHQVVLHIDHVNSPWYALSQALFYQQVMNSTS